MYGNETKGHWGLLYTWRKGRVLERISNPDNGEKGSFQWRENVLKRHDRKRAGRTN